MSDLQIRQWDKLTACFDSIDRIDSNGQPRAGRRTAAIIRDVFHAVGILLLARRRETTILPGLLRASRELLASMDASISLAAWADASEPPPEIDQFRNAIAQADADAATDPA